MYSFEDWYEINGNVLKDLYYKLFNISKSYGIILHDNKDTINNYLIMMYNESNKNIICEDYF